MLRINTGKASVLALIVSLGFTSFLLLRSLTTLVFSQGAPETVTICHATGSGSNPYVVNNPAKNGDVSGHDGHDGPVWFSGITVVWGDIIPPFTYVGGSYPGQNWTTEGQTFYNNGCNIPSTSPSPSPLPSPSPSPSVSPSPSTSPSPSPLPVESPSPSPTPTEEASPTPSPEVLGDDDVCDNIDGIQTSVPDGLHLDASGQNCVAFELSGAPTPPPAGQVLGAEAMGTTGNIEDNIFFTIFALGSFLAGTGVRKLTAPKR